MKPITFIIVIIFLAIPAFAQTAKTDNPENDSNYKLEYTSLLVGILTVLSSGVVAAGVSHRLAKSKEEWFYKRRKLEELYKCVERYTTLLICTNHMWLNVMDGELTFDQGLDMQINSKDDEDKNHLPEIDMLINLYFPNFLIVYDNFLKKRDAVNRIDRDFRDLYKAKGASIDYSNNRNEFFKALLEVENASKLLLKEIAKYSQKLN